MINYQYDLCTDRYIVSVEGHANYAPEGSDIVCAAASALALTLTEAVYDFDKAGDISSFSHSIEKGELTLDFTVKHDALERVGAVVEAITGGFLLLEENYPDCVCVT